MRHEALVDVDEIVAAVGAEARGPPLRLPSAPSFGNPVGASVGPSETTAIGEAADAPKGVGDDLALELDLHRGIDVLPSAAAAARGHVRDRAGRPGRPLARHRHDVRLGVVDVLLEHLDVDELAGKGAFDEHHPAVVVSCEGGAAGGHRGRAESEHRSSVGPRRGA